MTTRIKRRNTYDLWRDIKHREVLVNSDKLVLFMATWYVESKEENYLNILVEDGKNRQKSVSPAVLPGPEKEKFTLRHWHLFAV